MGIAASQQVARHLEALHLGGEPVGGVALGGSNRNRGDWFATEQRAEVQQPFLAEHADVQVNAVQRAEGSNRIGAVLEDARRPRGVRFDEEDGERIVRRHVVIELLVVEFAAGQRFLAPGLRLKHARPQLVHGIHRAGVVDVVS